MKLAIIAAIGKNRVIGKDGKMPWHIPEDLKRFKRLTTGHTILMGRKTFESIAKPLPNRRNVVISSKPILNIETYPSIEEALAALEDQDKVFIIGGGQIYARLLERTDELYLTFVDKEVEGDAFFPPYEHLLNSEFTLVHKETLAGIAFLDFVRLPSVTRP